jgi:hypothetical protein
VSKKKQPTRKQLERDLKFWSTVALVLWGVLLYLMFKDSHVEV